LERLAHDVISVQDDDSSNATDVDMEPGQPASPGSSSSRASSEPYSEEDSADSVSSASSTTSDPVYQEASLRYEVSPSDFPIFPMVPLVRQTDNDPGNDRSMPINMNDLLPKKHNQEMRMITSQEIMQTRIELLVQVATQKTDFDPEKEYMCFSNNKNGEVMILDTDNSLHYAIFLMTMTIPSSSHAKILIRKREHSKGLKHSKRSKDQVRPRESAKDSEHRRQHRTRDTRELLRLYQGQEMRSNVVSNEETKRTVRSRGRSGKTNHSN
jgi:hypothetical protein